MENLKFKTIRNIATTEMKKNGKNYYVGIVPAHAITSLPTDGNVRGYLALPNNDWKNNKRTYNQVHKEILDTLKNQPDKFFERNNGITITAEKIFVDEQNCIIQLENPQIGNGAQTHGCCKDFYEGVGEGEGMTEDEKNNHEAFIKVDIQTVDDADDAVEITIAKNNQTKVQDLSKNGKRGLFDDLKDRLENHDSNNQVKLSESDKKGTDVEDENFINPEKLLQVLFVMTPKSMIQNSPKYFLSKSNDSDYRTKFYTGKAASKKIFEAVYEAKNTDPAAEEIYKYLLDICGSAWELYMDWVKNDTKYISQFSKLKDIGFRYNKKTKKFISGFDGFIFPILSAYSYYIEKNANDVWEINTTDFPIKDVLEKATQHLTSNEIGSNANKMGKKDFSYLYVMLVAEFSKRGLKKVGS